MAEYRSQGTAYIAASISLYAIPAQSVIYWVTPPRGSGWCDAKLTG